MVLPSPRNNVFYPLRFTLPTDNTRTSQWHKPIPATCHFHCIGQVCQGGVNNFSVPGGPTICQYNQLSSTTPACFVVTRCLLAAATRPLVSRAVSWTLLVSPITPLLFVAARFMIPRFPRRSLRLPHRSSCRPSVHWPDGECGRLSSEAPPRQPAGHPAWRAGTRLQ